MATEESTSNVRSYIRPDEMEISSVLDLEGRLIVLTVNYPPEFDETATYWWRRGDPAYMKQGPFTDLDAAFAALDRFNT